MQPTVAPHYPLFVNRDRAHKYGSSSVVIVAKKSTGLEMSYTFEGQLLAAQNQDTRFRGASHETLRAPLPHDLFVYPVGYYLVSEQEFQSQRSGTTRARTR